MTDVYIEELPLDDGVPMMYRDGGSRLRVAYDSRQINEAAAIVVLCLSVPRLAGQMHLHRLTQPA